MPKYSFKNDYSEGAHPNILAKLLETNLIQQEGYANDEYCQLAAERIKSALERSDVDIHFISGGTQANQVVLTALLKPYESVIAASSGHIAVHEAGAIEATGHKINTVESTDGKLTVAGIDKVVKAHGDEHMVKPAAVFISQSTEVGTIYLKSELIAISNYCREKGLKLYLDGARLGSGLCNPASDLSLPELANLVDIFYIGGTKNGALLGEAIVIVNPDLKANFRYYLKRSGALLAKGRVIGVQFAELFNNNLYFSLATQANSRAADLTKGIKELDYQFLTESPTNQIFPVFPTIVIDKLLEKYDFYIWTELSNDMKAIRLVTSWATPELIVQEFLSDLKSFTNK